MAFRARWCSNSADFGKADLATVRLPQNAAQRIKAETAELADSHIRGVLPKRRLRHGVDHGILPWWAV